MTYEDGRIIYLHELLRINVQILENTIGDYLLGEKPLYFVLMEITLEIFIFA